MQTKILTILTSKGPQTSKQLQEATGIRSGHILSTMHGHPEIDIDRTQRPPMFSLRDETLYTFEEEAPAQLPRDFDLEEDFKVEVKGEFPEVTEEEREDGATDFLKREPAEMDEDEENGR